MRKFSDEHKRKLSEAHKGQIPWNKGKKLPPSHMLGKKHTEESKKKMSKSQRDNYKNGRVPWNKGIPMSDEAKKKLSEAKSGVPNPHKGVYPGHWAGKRRPEITGENHYLWNGGPDSEYEKIRKSPEMREWRRKVFERDDYICQSCGERGGRLQAHHIMFFSKFPEMRLLVSNGQTLCKECHARLHSEVGH
jgi:hypothetical protein